MLVFARFHLLQVLHRCFIAFCCSFRSTIHSFAVMAQLFLTLITVALCSFSTAVNADSANSCQSYGVDFQSGGSYFQNNGSSDPFTALQQFQGCMNVTAHNVLVDPDGNQKQCSKTPTQPDGKSMLVTCDQDPKDSLFTGNWSLLILGNNGDGAPLAAQRDFFLTVGAQKTVTVYPTVSVPAPSMIMHTIEKKTTTTFTSTVPATTVTVQPKHKHGQHGAPPAFGWTQHLVPSYVQTTKTLTTLTHTSTCFSIVAATSTAEAACTQPVATRCSDESLKIMPSVLGELDNIFREVVEEVGEALADIDLGWKREETATDKYRRAVVEGRQPTDEEKRGFVMERDARLAQALEKRAPDQRTTTVTALKLSTMTMLAEVKTLTAYVTHTESATTTVSSGTATVTAGAQSALVMTLPAPTFTWTAQQEFELFTTTMTMPYTYVHLTAKRALADKTPVSSTPLLPAHTVRRRRVPSRANIFGDVSIDEQGRYFRITSNPAINVFIVRDMLYMERGAPMFQS